MSAFLAMTLNGFREARRNRVTVVVGVFALMLLLTSSLLTEVTVWTFNRVLVDVGLGTMSLFLAVLAIFLSTAQLTREIERRTLYLILAKPISRATFVLGRLAANMLTLAVLLGGMMALYFLQLALLRVPITLSQLSALGMLMVELLIISAVGFAISSFASQTVSAISTAGLFISGHLVGDIYRQASKAEAAFLQVVGKGVYYLLPNLSRVNFRPLATYDVVPGATEVASAAVYGIGYSGIMICIAIYLFSHRDFR